ncbi:transcription factor GTE1-like protein [Tanacetum coccineum]
MNAEFITMALSGWLVTKSVCANFLRFVHNINLVVCVTDLAVCAFLLILAVCAQNILAADNRPPMLDNTNYSSWASRMLLYIKGKPNGKFLVDFICIVAYVPNVIPMPLICSLDHAPPGTEITLATVRVRTYTDLTDEEKLRESVDITLINDVHTIFMSMKPLQVNTKFVNHLQPEWSKFVTDVKLAKDMHTTNFDHLYAHLRKHEAHASEVRLERQRYSDQIALVANSPSCLNPTQYYPQLSSVLQQYYPSPAPQPHVLQQSYQAPAIQQSSSTELDSGLVVPSFNPSDDPIDNLNKLMAFVSTTFGPRFPQTNNQLRTSSNPRNQATIQDGRVNVQTVQGRQTEGYANNGARNTATNLGVNRQGALVQARVVKCYNCQEEGHFARQCTKPKRTKNSAWFKEKMLLSEALESGAYLDPKQLAFLADNGDTIILVQASQEIPTPTAFQTDDLDAFDSDCDDVPSAKAVLMANLSSYDSDVLSEVIVDRNAKFADFEKQIHSLKLQLNAKVESHKTLSTIVECLKKESKQKEDKYLDEVIDLQKKNKALDNVVYKMRRSFPLFLGSIPDPSVGLPQPWPSTPVIDIFGTIRTHKGQLYASVILLLYEKLGYGNVYPTHAKSDHRKHVACPVRVLNGSLALWPSVSG